jgi:hypothetical protein
MKPMEYGNMIDEIDRLRKQLDSILDAIPGNMEFARGEALESAAGIVQDWGEKYPPNSEERRCRFVMAAEIRALKSK